MMKPSGGKNRANPGLIIHCQVGRHLNVAVPLHLCQEVLRWQTPFRLPVQSPALVGVIHLRGETVPILELGGLLHLSPDGCQQQPARKEQRMLIIRYRDTLVGLTVDAVLAILETGMRRLFKKLDAACPINPELVSGCFKIKRQSIYLLNIPAILSQSLQEAGGYRMVI